MDTCYTNISWGRFDFGLLEATHSNMVDVINEIRVRHHTEIG